MSNCSRCGAQLSDRTKFCPKCGYLADIPPSPVVNDPTVVQAAPTPSAAFTGPLRGILTTRWALLVLALLVAAAAWWFFIRKDPVKDLQSRIFSDYGNATFGTVVDTAFPGVEWESKKVGGSYIVTISGVYLKEMMPVTIRFQVSYLGNTPVMRFLYFSTRSSTETDPQILRQVYEIYESARPTYGW